MKDKVLEFYQLDDFNKLCSSKKDFVSVFLNGKKDRFYFAWKSFISSLKRCTQIAKLSLASFVNLDPSDVLLSIVVGHIVYVSALITKMLHLHVHSCQIINRTMRI